MSHVEAVVIAPDVTPSMVCGAATVLSLTPMRLRKGFGYLAGEFPDGITTVDGVPVSAEVRVLIRMESGNYGDGVLVATTQSAVDGTWRVDGLPAGFVYDVVARLSGQNDVIMAGVTPAV